MKLEKGHFLTVSGAEILKSTDRQQMSLPNHMELRLSKANPTGTFPYGQRILENPLTVRKCPCQIIWRKCFLRQVLLGTFPYGQRILDFTPSNRQEMSLLFEIQRIDGMVQRLAANYSGSCVILILYTAKSVWCLTN